MHQSEAVGPPRAAAHTEGEVPPDVLAAARAAFDEREPHVLVADLVQDTEQAAEDDTDDRCLSFSGAGVRFEVRVAPASSARDAAVLVEVHPPTRQALVLHRPGESPVEVMPHRPGAFRVGVPGRGLFSVGVSSPRGPVRTAWTRL